MPKPDSIAVADNLILAPSESADSTSAPGFMDGIGSMFQAWDFQGLDSMANWLEVVGFTLALASFILSLIIKSEVSSIRNSFLLDKRLAAHIDALKKRAAELNRLIPNFINNKQFIVIELNKLQSELVDLSRKIGWWSRIRLLQLARRASKRSTRPFKKPTSETPPFFLFFTQRVRRVFMTTPGDLWQIHGRLHRVINDMEAHKQNRAKSLRS